MKQLAKIVRRGCKIRTVKCVGKMFYGDNAACVIGAAWLGSGRPVDREEIMAPFVELRTYGIMAVADHPLGTRHPHNGKWLVGDIMMNLNDKQGWSRERIAAWLEGLDHG